MFHTLLRYLKEARLGIFPLFFLLLPFSSSAATPAGDATKIVEVICSAVKIIDDNYIIGITSVMLAFALLVGLFQQFNSSMFVKILVLTMALMAAGPLSVYIYGGSCK